MTNSRKILIIETDHDTRVLYRKTLEDVGYVIVSTTTGKDGLDILRKNLSSIKLILLAIDMPVMDGNDFLKIKSIDPTLAGIPVIVITAYPDSVHHPATDIIKKPLGSSEVVKIAKQFVP